MVKGIGTDIIEIDRIKKTIDKQSFLDKIFTKTEQKLYHGVNPQTLAGNFAAKEAVAKALGTGFAGCSPIEIEVLRDLKGKPYVNLYGSAKDLLDSIGGQVYISISHSKENAIAFAIIED
ncbi:MAG: holo-ACP synthase [Clostridia bacterium]|nr:holo-ACP synthase [Clostridia bacterium]